MTEQHPLLVVIDDEQGILDVVSRFARRTGYEVVTCSGGREAIALLQTRRADLVLVDLRMPDVGGLDVLRAIRDTDPRCQAILMTGYASVDTAVDAIKLGAAAGAGNAIRHGLGSGSRDLIGELTGLVEMEDVS